MEENEANLLKYVESLLKHQQNSNSKQNMTLKHVEIDVQCVWLEAGQKSKRAVNNNKRTIESYFLSKTCLP